MTQQPEPQDAAASSPEGPGGERERAGSDFRSSMSGLDHSSIMGVELMSAIVVWTGIGWLLDEWLGTGPILMIVGALIGNSAGLYLIWLRSGRMEEAERRASAARRDLAERPRVVSSPIAAVVDAVVAGRTGIPTAAHTHGIDPREQTEPSEPADPRDPDDADAPGGRLLER
jgi:ATP synthase protein I